MYSSQKKKKTKRENRLDRLLEMPREISSNEPKFTVTGFDQILIENYQAILEYQEYYIRINTSIGILNINGFSLNLKEMTEDDLLITGKIDSLDFEPITDE